MKLLSLIILILSNTTFAAKVNFDLQTRSAEYALKEEIKLKVATKCPKLIESSDALIVVTKIDSIVHDQELEYKITINVFTDYYAHSASSISMIFEKEVYHDYFSLIEFSSTDKNICN